MKINEAPHYKGIVFFDGYCTLCNGAVRLLLKLDKGNRLLFSNFDSTVWQEISGNITPGTDSIVFYHNGRISLQSQAVVEILQMLDPPWCFLSLVKYIPFRLRESVYTYIARNRYRIFKRKTSCSIPPTGARQKFIR